MTTFATVTRAKIKGMKKVVKKSYYYCFSHILVSFSNTVLAKLSDLNIQQDEVSH